VKLLNLAPGVVAAGSIGRSAGFVLARAIAVGDTLDVKYDSQYLRDGFNLTYVNEAGQILGYGSIHYCGDEWARGRAGLYVIRRKF
jgi:hypothetical protein